MTLLNGDKMRPSGALLSLRSCSFHLIHSEVIRIDSGSLGGPAVKRTVPQAALLVKTEAFSEGRAL